MDHLISWKEYILYAGFCLLLYYAFVIVKFYRKELLQLKFPNVAEKNNSATRLGTLFTTEPSSSAKDLSYNPLSSVVHDFSFELKVMLKQLAAQQAERRDVLKAIAKLIRKYAALKGSEFQTGITNLIVAETDSECKLQFTAEELVSIWS